MDSDWSEEAQSSTDKKAATSRKAPQMIDTLVDSVNYGIQVGASMVSAATRVRLDTTVHEESCDDRSDNDELSHSGSDNGSSFSRDDDYCSLNDWKESEMKVLITLILLVWGVYAPSWKERLRRRRDRGRFPEIPDIAKAHLCEVPRCPEGSWGSKCDHDCICRARVWPPASRPFCVKENVPMPHGYV
ncbi:hypothetical protein V5799_003319 [Amblyomma americanum]|uniref:Uncharacterized protein n=1 Tax=Amblyomma americanum TaxID=6943 RepID=A0AAQ4D9B0_AMBAM